MSWYKLARVGEFKGHDGQIHKVTRDLLNKIAGNYNPKNAPAALTIGHPKESKEPAYGWVDALKIVGDELFFKPGKVVAQFAEAVNKGMFPHVSIGFDETPVPMIKHVAFLGAVQPAVKGLGQVAGLEFSETPGAAVSIDFSEPAKDWLLGQVQFCGAREHWLVYQMRNMASMFQRLREQEIEKNGVDAADKVFPSYYIDDLKNPPPEVNDTMKAQPIEFSQPTATEEVMNPEELLAAEKAGREAADAKIVELSAKVTALEGEKTTLQAQIVTLETAKRIAAHTEFCESMISQGKVLPDEKATIIEQLEALSKIPGTVEFSSPTGEKSQRTQVELFKAGFEKRPKLVEFSELAGRAQQGTPEQFDEFVKAGKAIADSLK